MGMQLVTTGTGDCTLTAQVARPGAGGDRFNSGWAELSGLKVIGAIKICTLKTAASRSNTAPTRTPELLPLLQERRKLHLHIYFFRGGVDPREVFTRKCLELRNASHSGKTTTAAQPQLSIRNVFIVDRYFVDNGKYTRIGRERT